MEEARQALEGGHLYGAVSRLYYACVAVMRREIEAQLTGEMEKR